MMSDHTDRGAAYLVEFEGSEVRGRYGKIPTSQLFPVLQCGLKIGYCATIVSSHIV